MKSFISYRYIELRAGIVFQADYNNLAGNDKCDMWPSGYNFQWNSLLLF